MFSQYPFQVQPPPTPEPEGIECDYCGGFVEVGDEVVEINPGILGKGPKSGRPMVLDDPTGQKQIATVHPWCAREFIYHFIFDDDEPAHEPLCSACEAKLDGPE